MGQQRPPCCQGRCKAEVIGRPLGPQQVNGTCGPIKLTHIPMNGDDEMLKPCLLGPNFEFINKISGEVYGLNGALVMLSQQQGSGAATTA
jgi:hypothetical protein